MSIHFASSTGLLSPDQLCRVRIHVRKKIQNLLKAAKIGKDVTTKNQ
jgi:predicted RNA-binding Zn ribbon-like protein